MAVVNGIRSQLLTRTAKKGSTTTLFSETLRYDSPTRGTAARYGGGISEVMTLQGSACNTYGFTYDAAGRLMTTTRFTGTTDTGEKTYTEQDILYNSNGALLRLKRYGSDISTPQDDYSYTYSGPLLTGVSGKDEGSNINASFSHDSNGNTTADGRANLSFAYNILNLPETVTSGNTQMATYHWLADGTKYRAEDANGNGVIYAGDLTYTATASGGNTTYALESAEASADGTARFLKNGTAMTPYYTIRDHLGSVRTIVNASGTVVERNDYYPFGSRTTYGASYPTLASNRQKFSGKEDQTAVAGSTLPYLDFGARMYDAKLVRWNTYDPMAEKYYGINPYVYCAGNPVNLLDPEGRDIYSFDRKTGEISLYRVEEDKDYDTLVKIKHRRGEDKEKVLITNIEKGILHDNVNYKNSDQIYTLTVEGAPSQGGIESFVLELSNLVGKEIGGAYFSDNGLSPVTEITIGRYCNNTLRETRSHGHLYWATRHSLNPLIGLIGFFHTHPFYDGRDIPSGNDLEARDKNKEMKPSMEFYIITYPIYYGDPTPYKILYTEW